MDDKHSHEWHFDFGLCVTRDNQLIPHSKCEELLEIIISWAEDNDISIGGGFKEFMQEKRTVSGLHLHKR